MNKQTNKKKDVGCGFGGLLYSLATAFPDNVAMGLEIRAKVVEYVSVKKETNKKGMNENKHE